MISTLTLSDVYFCVREFDANTIDTTIKVIRNTNVEVSLDGVVLPSREYFQEYITGTNKIRIIFRRKHKGYLCVFRDSNNSNLIEFGAEKSKGQNENFFDSLVQFLQDEGYERGVTSAIYSLGFTRDDFDLVSNDTDSLLYLNNEGKKTTLNGRAYMQSSDFNIRFNSYSGSIASGIPSEGVFGDRRKDTVEVDKTVPFVQDIETGLSISGQGYTLVKEITLDDNGNITSMDLYRRMLDHTAETYNVQKAMIGTTATTATIYHGNDTYICTVDHRYDLIRLNVVSFTSQHSFNRFFTGFATMAIDLGIEVMQLYIENNGIVLKDFV